MYGEPCFACALDDVNLSGIAVVEFHNQSRRLFPFRRFRERSVIDCRHFDDSTAILHREISNGIRRLRKGVMRSGIPNEDRFARRSVGSRRTYHSPLRVKIETTRIVRIAKPLLRLFFEGKKLC